MHFESVTYIQIHIERRSVLNNIDIPNFVDNHYYDNQMLCHMFGK